MHVIRNKSTNFVSHELNLMKFIFIIRKIFYRYPVSLIMVSVIIYLSLFKPQGTNLYKIQNIDKLAHFCMYTGFCSVIWFEYLRSHKTIVYRRILYGAFVAPIIFSGIMEIFQSLFTENRTGDWFDFLFNILGVITAGIFSIYVIKPFINKYKLFERNSK